MPDYLKTETKHMIGLLKMVASFKGRSKEFLVMFSLLPGKALM